MQSARATTINLSRQNKTFVLFYGPTKQDYNKEYITGTCIRVTRTQIGFVSSTFKDLQRKTLPNEIQAQAESLVASLIVPHLWLEWIET